MIPPFEEQLRAAARAAGLDPTNGPAMLAHVSYQQEYAVKSKVAQGFLKALAPKDGLAALVQAPMPRGYRTTSRRRVWRDRRGVRLVHGDVNESAMADALEPAAHLRVYERLAPFLRSTKDPLVDVLNHVIVRGTYDEHVLILNVRELSAEIIRSARAWTRAVTKEVPSVHASWLYVDPKGSRYYLDTDRPLRGVSEKKVTGERAWRQSIGDAQYQVGVFSFTQVNLAMAHVLVDVVKRCSGTQPSDVLVDLYGGYGLFGAAMASGVKSIVTMDADQATVDNARYNIRRAGGTVNAVAMPVTPASIRRVIDHADVVVLDPPRSGTEPGVIAAVAEANPRRVVHVFCGPDEIRRSLAEWKTSGYTVDEIVPLDLFPGTAGLEVVIALRPSST